MTIPEIIKRLNNYQKWRRGRRVKQPDPQEVGETIDEAIRALRKIEKEKK